MAVGAHVQEILKAASLAEEMLILNQLPTENEAKRRALFATARYTGLSQYQRGNTSARDKLYSVRLSFSGLILSVVDRDSLEICTVTLKNLNAMAKWNLLRTSDASLLMSLGGVQVDNHVPSAPFPVALCPDGPDPEDNKKPRDIFTSGWARTSASSSTGPPFLFVGIELGPTHSSGIVVSIFRGFFFDG